jgi:hypothetical protein
VVVGNQALDDHDVEPLAIEASVLFVDADVAEATAPTERQAGGVERKDARDQLPVAALAGRVDERLEEAPAQAAALRRRIAAAQASLELLEGGLNCEYEDITQCPNFKRLVADRIPDAASGVRG